MSQRHDPNHITESVPVQIRIGAVNRMGVHLMTLKCQGTSHELRKRDRKMLMSHERMCQLSLRREARREIGYIRFAVNLILRSVLMIQARLTRINTKHTHVALPKDFSVFWIELLQLIFTVCRKIFTQSFDFTLELLIARFGLVVMAELSHLLRGFDINSLHGSGVAVLADGLHIRSLGSRV